MLRGASRVLADARLQSLLIEFDPATADERVALLETAGRGLAAQHPRSADDLGAWCGEFRR